MSEFGKDSIPSIGFVLIFFYIDDKIELKYKYNSNNKTIPNPTPIALKKNNMEIVHIVEFVGLSCS